MSTWFARTNQTTLAQYRWLLETSRARAGTTERVLDRPRAGKIVAASLGWSEAYAAGRIEFARQLLERLPALGAAMAEGWLEEHKAWLFASTLAELADTTAREVVARVLPAAPRLAFSPLRARIEQTAQALDQDWAAARRAAAVARRRVSFRIAPSGAAELCGLDLPEESAQDAHDRIVALARLVAAVGAAPGSMPRSGRIQSEVILTLTGPDGAGMWDEDVIEHVVARFDGPTGGPEDDPDDGGPDDDGPDGDPEDDGPDDDHPGGRPGDGEPDDHTHGGSASDGAGRDGFRDADPEERVGLRTALGLDRRPGLIPGHGPITNAIAVSMTWNRPHSTFRLLLYRPDGALDHVLVVRPPRSGQPPPHAHQRRHHIIELTVHTGELDDLIAALAPAPSGGGGQRAAVLHGATPSEVLVRGDALGLLERAARALAAARARPIHEHPAHTITEEAHRHPSAALRA